MAFLETEYEDKELKELLKRLQKKLGDLREPMEEVGQWMLASTDENFEMERDPYGGPWPENSPWIKQMKAKRGFIQKILQQRGFLRNSINYKATSDGVTVGTSVSYAYEHQMGVGQVRRQFLGVGEGDRREILSILGGYLEEG